MPLLGQAFHSFFELENQRTDKCEECGRNLHRRLEEYLSEMNDKIVFDLLSLFPVPVLVTSRKNKTIFINTTFTTAFGYTSHDVQDLSKWYQVAYPDSIYRESLLAQFHLYRQKNSHDTIPPLEVTLTCSNQRIKTCEIYYLEVENLTIAVFVDISLRKQMEFELWETSTKLEEKVQQALKKRSQQARIVAAIFNSEVVGIILTDKEGIILEANQHFGSIFGYDSEDLMGKSFTLLSPTPTQTLEHYKQMLQEPTQCHSIESHWLTKEGHLRDVHLSYGFVEDDLGNPCKITIVYDMTELNKLKEEQKRQEAMLIQQSKMAAMGEMIGAIAHQWRQPLNSLAIKVQDIKDAYDYDELTPEYIDEFVSSIMDNIAFMTHTIEDFRNFFNPDKPRQSFSLKRAGIDVFNMIRNQFRDNDIHVEFVKLKNDNEGYEFDLVEGHENEFKQVMLNLLVNAKDQILDKVSRGLIGDEQKKIVITVSCIAEGKMLTVQDFAGGIPSDHLQKIFASGFSTKGDKGTGIGLYMSKLIIEESFKGKLAVTNKDGGACFSIIIP